jgi:hypothetical protein
MPSAWCRWSLESSDLDDIRWNLYPRVAALRAERLIEEGDRAIKRSDVPSLRTIVWELHGLLPSSQRGALDRRFHDAGLKQTQSKQ